MISSWQDLEEAVKELLKKDNPVKPKGSGSVKKEEDIVSNNIIAQCKFTSNTNITILERDLDRLLEACKLQDKFPLFITNNGYDNLLSLPITTETDTIIQEIINLIICFKALNKIKFDIKFITTQTELQSLDKLFDKYSKLFNCIIDKFNTLKQEYSKTSLAKWDNLTMHNLFDEDNYNEN